MPCFLCFDNYAYELMVGCSEHPLTNVVLKNGYTVPMCDDHACNEEGDPMADFDNWDGPPNLMAFYGLIHRAQKKASSIL